MLCPLWIFGSQPKHSRKLDLLQRSTKTLTALATGSSALGVQGVVVLEEVLDAPATAVGTRRAERRLRRGALNGPDGLGVARLLVAALEGNGGERVGRARARATAASAALVAAAAAARLEEGGALVVVGAHCENETLVRGRRCGENEEESGAKREGQERWREESVERVDKKWEGEG